MWKDEFTGLDLEHSSIAMQTFGKMHEVGLVIHETKILQDDNLLQLLNLDITIFFGALSLELIDEGITAFISWMKEHDVDNGSILALEHQLRDRKYMKTCSGRQNFMNFRLLLMEMQGLTTCYSNMILKARILLEQNYLIFKAHFSSTLSLIWYTS